MKKYLVHALIFISIILVISLIGSNYFWFVNNSALQTANLNLSNSNSNLENDNATLLVIFSVFEAEMASREASVAIVASEAAVVLSELDARTQKNRLEEEKLAQLSARLSDYDKLDCNNLMCSNINDDTKRMKCVDDKVACYQHVLEQHENWMVLMAQTKNSEKEYQRLIEEAKQEAAN
jgi:hypothetical protein